MSRSRVCGLPLRPFSLKGERNQKGASEVKELANRARSKRGEIARGISLGFDSPAAKLYCRRPNV